jgi:hypothetical protein
LSSQTTSKCKRPTLAFSGEKISRGSLGDGNGRRTARQGTGPIQFEAKIGPAARLVDRTSATDERFAWRAAEIDAGASRQSLFCHRDAMARNGKSLCGIVCYRVITGP